MPRQLVFIPSILIGKLHICFRHIMRMESEEDMWRLPYYHGVLSKANTERMLTKEGDFLIRLGDHTTSDAGQKQPMFVLSVNVSNNETIHVVIRQRRGRVAVDFGQDKSFKTIQQFVDTHWLKGDSIAKDEHVILRRPIPVHDLQEFHRPSLGLSSLEQQINVSDQVWADTMQWIGRDELGTKFALINTAFDTLVDIQLGERSWSLAELHIEPANDGTGAAQVRSLVGGISYIVLPLATTPLLDSVVGFKTISIWYVDKSVIAFLVNIRRLLVNDAALEISIPLTEYRSWDVVSRWIWPLMQNGIGSLFSMHKADVAMLRKLVSPTALLDCANLRRVHAFFVPKCPSAAGDKNDDGDPLHVRRDLYTWIHAPREGARHVVLYIIDCCVPQWEQFVTSLLKSLEQASYPINYIIYTEFPGAYDDYVSMENVLTQERIVLSTRIMRGLNNAEFTHVALKRCPLQQTDQQLMDWAVYVNRPITKLVHLTFGDDNIGPLPSDDGADLM